MESHNRSIVRTELKGLVSCRANAIVENSWHTQGSSPGLRIASSECISSI